MKQFGIRKVGYSAGVYGCSNEYFVMVATIKGELRYLPFKGMYGVEERVARIMTENGYTKVFLGSTPGGQLKGNGKLGYANEDAAIREIKELLGVSND